MRVRDDELFMRRLVVHLGERAMTFSDELLEMLYGVWLDGERHGAALLCTHCGATEGVEFVQLNTAYAPTNEDPDPNLPIPYCPSCAEFAHEYFEAMWEDYRSSQGF